MKKVFLVLGLLMTLSLGSCSSIKHTATTLPVETNVVSTATADLAVSPTKITYTYRPTSAVRRTGEKGCYQHCCI